MASTTFRCYHSHKGAVCGRKLVVGVITGPDDWVEVHCPKCKNLAVFPRRLSPKTA